MPNIVLLGGARRVTLAEQIHSLLKPLGATKFYSLERSEDFYPISAIAEVVAAPKFKDAEFDVYLSNFLRSRQASVLGCMDAAIPSIARLAGQDLGGGRVVGPSLQGAEISLNKVLTSEFCAKVGIRHPRRYFRDIREQVSVIAKPIEGFGGKGIHILAPDQHHLLAELESTHIIQELIVGAETTHDLYIDEKRNVHACSRDRLAVIDGEVDHCIVRRPRESEMEVFDKIASTGLFWGPLTVQTFHSESGETVLIEINARLGGGVTASIAAGFPVIELFAEESFGVSLPRREFKPLEMKRARRDFYRFLA